MRIIVIAGPNGAGKTTFARRYLEGLEGNRPFVNGDDIAAKLHPANPASVAQTAGRMALREMDTLVAQRADFAVETTLSGRGYAKRIRAWQAMGYRVSVIYLRLSSADQTVERVAKRVSEGGHDIPESVARRRFERSWGNFCDLYREIADDWRVYDNSRGVPVLIAQSRGWQEVREPRLNRRYRHLDHQIPGEARRDMAKKQLSRFPDGEPSVKNVLAALKRAREDAMARQEAVKRGEPVFPPHHEPVETYRAKTASRTDPA